MHRDCVEEAVVDMKMYLLLKIKWFLIPFLASESFQTKLEAIISVSVWIQMFLTVSTRDTFLLKDIILLNKSRKKHKE